MREVHNRRVVWLIGGLVLAAAAAPARTITAFDTPLPGTSVGQGTLATEINAAGAITVHYADSAGLQNGHVRVINGKVGSAKYLNFTALTVTTTGLCSKGTAVDFASTSTGWTWACQGSGGGSTDSSGVAYYTSASALSLAQTVKYSGCTFAGLIGTSTIGSEATGTNSVGNQLTLFNNYVDLISYSNCTYIGRAIVTWDWPPDFTAISTNITAFYNQLQTLSPPAGAPQSYVFGFYMAERVSLTLPYYYPAENRNFNFADMCASPPGPTDIDCLASFNQPEFVTYVTYLLTSAIDLGLQVYLFGEVSRTDPKGTAESSNLVNIINQMRSYAASMGTTVVFIAQDPSTSGGPAYFNNFDLIQGGAYISADGTIPNTPIVTNKGAGNFPRRLWLETNNKGKPVFNLQKLVIEYDWYTNPVDDSSEVACLSIQSQPYLDFLQSLSSANCPLGTIVGSAVPTTTTIYDTLQSLGVGFWLPGRQTIAYPPFYYTPINLTLAPGTAEEINFNDEGVLAIGLPLPLGGGAAASNGASEVLAK